MTASAVYQGWVAHRRLDSVGHSFRYRVFLPFLDLDELPEALDAIPFWSARRAAPARFDSADFLGGFPSLSEAARDLTETRLGRRPRGPVRVLANPRYLGVGFNPISLLFCYDLHAARVESVIAEVSNTPWRERTAYVLDGRARNAAGEIRDEFEKAMHVSPFQSMRQSYAITVDEPGERLRVAITNLEQGRRVFSATMGLRRRELTPARMTRLLLRYPPMTIATMVRIYANAVRLRIKRAPFHPHPTGPRVD